MSSREVDRGGSGSRGDRKSLLRLWGISLLVTAALFALVWILMGPPPPSRLVFATGPEDGAYHGLARRYREALAREGLHLEIRDTAGSVENLALLERGEADLAFVQGGTATEAQRAGLRSLASVFFEPLWIFLRGEIDLHRLAVLKDLRVAVGPEGSGTRSLAVHLLGGAGLIGSESGEGGVTLLPLAGGAAAEALLAGEIDAALFVVAPDAAWLLPLLASEDLRLVQLHRNEAYVRRYRFLDFVKLPEGVLDLEADLPRTDLELLAPTAALASRADLHDALVPVLLAAARKIHAGGSLIAGPGRFPSPHHVDLPLDDDARRYFDHGPSWLSRVFPFRVASLLDRAVLLLLPLLTLLFPLIKTAPPLYRWGVRRRIYRWYREVRAADRLTRKDSSIAALEEGVAKLKTIEKEVGGVSIPLSYMAEFYQLRLHLDFVHKRLERRLRGRGS